eukprot:19549-Heterococcus_DN1.PRE.1
MAPAELTAMSSNSLSALLSAVAGGCMALSLAALLMLSSSSSALSPSGAAVLTAVPVVHNTACMYAQLSSHNLNRHRQQTGAVVINARRGRKHIGVMIGSCHCEAHTHMANIFTTSERNGRTDVSSVSRLVAAGGVLLNSC